ncbi:unnamed protein product [Caenorhabditis angaria]|uniref:RING-type domain-containing protein n=1 Tax=Caenorhabditis angaria TaxID=860376 RepID=A0A9P1IKU7_9PELO|nr:unnamed protein product [Caenorhabditis angaria]
MDDSFSKITDYKCAVSHGYQKPAAYFMTGCKHFLCEICSYSSYGDTRCDKCSSTSTRMRVSDLMQSINEERIVLKINLEEMRNELEEKNNELKEKTDELESKMVRLDLYDKSIEDHLKCSECDLTESEQRIQLCGTCHGLQFDNLDNAKNCAICSSCSIKKHIRNGHNTVDFFPIFRSLHYENHSNKIKESLDNFKNSITTCNNDCTGLVDANLKVKQQMDLLIDMVRRSKSTTSQQLLNNKLSTFIEKSNSMAKNANLNMENNIKKIGDQLEILRKWNEDHQDYIDPSTD